MSDNAPTADQAFGPAPAPLPTADEAFGPEPQDDPGASFRGPQMDEHFAGGTVGELLHTFGQGFQQGWGSQPLGLSPDTEQWLKHVGIFDEAGGHNIIKEFNEGLIRPTATALDLVTRAGTGLYHGLGDVALRLGVPRDIVAMPEAFPTGDLAGGTALGPSALHAAPAPELAAARQLGVIGKGEAGWLGASEAPAAEATAEAARRLQPTGIPSQSERVVARAAPAPAAPPDIHQVARAVAPETFAEYDALTARKQLLRDNLDQLGAQRAQRPEAQAAQAQIDDILGKVNGVESRLTNAARGRLEDARDQLQALTTTDTDEMADLRQQLMQADYRMRDLAPDVSAAYRQAAAQMPPEAAATPEPEAPIAATETGNPAGAATEAAGAQNADEATTLPATPKEAAPAPAGATIARPEQLPLPGSDGAAEIASDVSRQLVAAGRPQNEADAAAAIVAAHYEARAQRWEGRLGSAVELYRREGARIRGAVAGGPRGSAAGRSMLRQARTTITLFEKADASTFLHETGHQWLGELLRDADSEDAPADLKADAATVRGWLGAGSEPTRAQHEMFARGFEAYLMEGRAPSAGLARVFEQFRQWLLAIYNRVTAQKLPVIDSVRGVYDRLLAMPDRIAIAAGEPQPAEVTQERAAALLESPAAPYGEADLGRLQEAEAKAEARLAPVATRRMPETAYEPVPKEPTRLAEFLRQQGGVRDEGGELRQIEAGKRPGLVNRNGMSLDEAALKAWEEGYFPELAERPTIDDLVQALDDDLRGRPRYTAKDEAAVAAFRQALGRNAEIDRLAAQLGIDPRDWTKEQFWNLAAEHLAAEKNADLQNEIDAAREAEFAEAERRAKEWAASRGDAWEPEIHRGRTLEDIERENEAEQLAGNAGAQPRRAERAGPAAGNPRPLQERGGQGGSAGGVGSGAGAAENAADAGRHFGPGSRLVDKAGNIRLDNLSQPDDIDDAIRGAASRNSDFRPERRGRLSDGEVLDLAEALGRDPAFLDAKKIGDAFNAEEVMAARRLLVASATAVRDEMQRVAWGADPLDLARLIARHEMIQGKVAQATAEWGRAGRSFRALMEGQPAADQLAEFLKQNSGRTLYQIQEMAKLGQSLDTPAQVSKFIADTRFGKVRRAIVYYWVNALISGPVTHLRYSVGNALNALWMPLVETPVAAVIGRLRGAEDRVYLGESLAQIYSLAKGTADGWKAGYEAFRANRSPPLPGERVPAQFLGEQQTPIPGMIGTAIGVPGRSVAAIHSFFKAIRYEQQIQALAFRQAMREGLEGDAFANRIAELTTSPTDAMTEAATRTALKELYMAPTEYHSVMGALVRASNHPSAGGLALKILAPFLKIGSQVTRNAFMERTPLGLANKEIRGNVLSGTAATDLQLAKMTAGIGLAATAVMMTMQGLVTGDGPSDPNRRAVWLLSHRPNSIRIGDVTIPYQGLGNLGMLLRFAANMTETAQGWHEEDGGKLAIGFLEGFTKSVLDENFMRGVKDALDAVYHPTEYGPSFLRSFAANWLPYSIGLGQVARVIDPYSREDRTLLTAAEARIPLLSERLQPRRDRFGEPIPNITGLPHGLGGAARYAADPTVETMERLQLGIGPIGRKVRGVALDDRQYDDLQRIAGRLAKIRLDAFAGLPQFREMPPEMQIDLIHKTISQARESARTLLLMQNPALIAAAVAAKTAALKKSQAR